MFLRQNSRNTVSSVAIGLFVLLLIVFVAPLVNGSRTSAKQAQPNSKTVEIPFKSYDGYPMLGKLTVPLTPGPHPVVVYVQTSEGMTVDVKRPLGREGSFNYFDLYRDKLPAMNVAFFSYEGRGIRLGDKPPRFETIDWDVYNTSTLDNKVRDALSAIDVASKQPGIDGSRLFLMGASEGTLLASEAAARAKDKVHGLVLYAVLSSNMRENFRYIVTGGAFLSTWLGNFDTDKDGKISRAEFEADPWKFREKVLKNAPFEALDKNNDGFFTLEEFDAFANPLRDAVDQQNFTVLDDWAKNSAGVSTPQGWFKDHFAHPPIWTFLSQLNIPVGIFQGEADAMVPVAGVRILESTAKKAGKSKMEFHYFPDVGHSLGITEYFSKGSLPAGHQAIFEFIKKQSAKWSLFQSVP